MFLIKQLLLFCIPFDSFDSSQQHLFFVHPKTVNLVSHFVCALAVPNQHNLGLKVHQLYFYTSIIKNTPLVGVFVTLHCFPMALRGVEIIIYKKPLEIEFVSYDIESNV